MSRNESEVTKTPTATLPQPAGDGEQLSLFSTEALSAVAKQGAEWKRTTLDPQLAKKGPWKKDFTTVSGMENRPPGAPVASPDRQSS